MRRKRGDSTSVPAGPKLANHTFEASSPVRAWVAPGAIAVLIVLLGIDTLRIQFFADDFHFLDVARRVPLGRALTGAFGLWPWYRPLSRECYFAMVAGAGPLGLPVAHVMSLACLGAGAWQVFRIARRLAGARAGSIATVLFLTHATTKFLAGWASGFQDLLSLLLVLLAVDAQFEGRRNPASTFALLGMFAKETAVVGLPLLLLAEWLLPHHRRLRATALRSATVLSVAGVVHSCARVGWNSAGGVGPVERSAGGLANALWSALSGFAGPDATSSGRPIVLAVIAAAAAWALVTGTTRALRGGSRAGVSLELDRAPRRTWVFLSGATLLGLAPLIVGHALSLVHAEGYYAFPAVPWLAMLAATALARVPGRLCAGAVAALVAWNTLAFGWRDVDLASPEAWRFRRWDWAEAMRLSAVSDRLGQDLRANLASRPESLVVLLTGLENGCFFQTEDGPAVRVSLQDPTVHAHWLSSPPFGLRAGHFEILVFNRESRHLERHRLPMDLRRDLAAGALASGRYANAWALASYGDSTENARVTFAYLRWAAACLERGPEKSREEQSQILSGGGDSLVARAAARHEVGVESPLALPLGRALHRPLESSTHVELADAFERLGNRPMEAVELRLAVMLDAAQPGIRERLAAVLESTGPPEDQR